MPDRLHGVPGDVEPVVAPPPGHPRFPLIDGLRGGAALFIVTAHALGLSGVLDDAWYRALFKHNPGLVIFFMVSGFVIYRPFVAQRVLGAPHPGFLSYARRRFLRILPPYWLILTLLALYPGLRGVLTDDWWVFYGLLQVFPVYDTAACAGGVGCGIPTAVTLPGEIWFYILLPIYVLFFAALVKPHRAPRWLRTELLLLGGLAAASVLARVWAGVHEPFVPWLFFGTFGTFLWLGLGMAMAAVSVAREGKPANRAQRLISRHPGPLWAAAVAICLGLGLVYPVPVQEELDGLGIFVDLLALGAAGVLFMLPAVVGESDGGLPRRVLSNSVLGWLGVISYGLYLFHIPIQLELLRVGAPGLVPGATLIALLVMSLGLTVVCAAASYYLFERPLLKLKEPRRRARARRAASGVA